MPFALIEPLRTSLRTKFAASEKTGVTRRDIAETSVSRTGLAVRLLGEVKAEHLKLLREADAIVREEIKRAGLYGRIWQAFAVLLPVRSVGVMGDGRTYGLTAGNPRR